MRRRRRWRLWAAHMKPSVMAGRVHSRLVGRRRLFISQDQVRSTFPSPILREPGEAEEVDRLDIDRLPPATCFPAKEVDQAPRVHDAGIERRLIARCASTVDDRELVSRVGEASPLEGNSRAAARIWSGGRSA